MENFTRAFTVSGNVITDSKPTKKAGNAGENIVTSLSFTFSSEWDDAIKSIVFKSPKNKLLTPQTITGSIAPIPQDALDSGGTLQFSLMGAFADSEQVIRTPTYGLDVESTLSILGGTPLATYTNVVLDCQLATQDAIDAKDLALSAASSCAATDAAVQENEAARVIAEAARGAQFVSTDETESAVISDTELIDASGWTSLGWTGDLSTGFTHISGNTSALSRSIGTTGTKLYQLEFDVSAPLAADELTVQIGNSATFDLYKGDITHYSAGIQSVSDGALVFTPISTCAKTISNISVKEITAPYDTNTNIKDSTGLKSYELRATKSVKSNLFIGVDSGKYNTTGHDNAGIGSLVLGKNTSGFWNSGIGKNALSNNTVGSRNTSIGYNALLNNICGHRNLAIGSFALCGNVNGNKNHAIGSDALYHNISGNGNMAIGWGTQYSRVSGNSNIAFGNNAMYSDVSGNYQIAIGDSAMANGTTGSNNLAIGYYALNRNSTGGDNIAIGLYAAKGAVGTNQSQNVVIGNYAAQNIADGSVNNTIIGHNAASNLTTGKGNIVIGMNATCPDPAGYQLMNIGNVLYGDLYSKYLGIGVTSPRARLHIMAADGSNYGVPIKLTAGTLSTAPQSGAIEFDGEHLYVSISGVRKTIQVA